MKGTEGPQRVFDEQRVEMMGMRAGADRAFALQGAQVFPPLHARAQPEPGNDRPHRRDDGEHDRAAHAFDGRTQEILVSFIDVQRIEGTVDLVHIDVILAFPLQLLLAGDPLFFVHFPLPCIRSARRYRDSISSSVSENAGTKCSIK